MRSVRKTWLIDPALVTHAKKVCGAKTETEAVTRALREMVIRDEVEKAFRRHGPALAGLHDIFHDRAISEPE